MLLFNARNLGTSGGAFLTTLIWKPVDFRGKLPPYNPISKSLSTGVARFAI